MGSLLKILNKLSRINTTILFEKNIDTSQIKMVIVTNRRPIKKCCEYNFCSNGDHHIVQKKKDLSKPNEFMLLALANTTQKRIVLQHKENKMMKYNAKKNEKTATQMKKRALKLTNHTFGAR